MSENCEAIRKMKNERPPREGREAIKRCREELGLSLQIHSFLGDR